MTTIADAYRRGYVRGEVAANRETCPYVLGSSERKAWFAGLYDRSQGRACNPPTNALGAERALQAATQPNLLAPVERASHRGSLL